MENKKWYSYTHSIIMLSAIGVLVVLLISLILINTEKNTKETSSDIMGTIQVAQDENKVINEQKNNEIETVEQEEDKQITTNNKENNTAQNSEKSNNKQTSNTVKKENSVSSNKTNTTTNNISSVTLGEKNALNSAKNYLSIMPFSKQGLIKQLEYEGYSEKEAQYGANNCGANWNEQASKMAKQYLDMMSFSKSGLIEQLKYEGFTTSQAEYGAKSVGY